MKNPILWTKDFLLIAGSNFFLFLTFYLLLVTLPVYAIEDLHSDKSKVGHLTTLFLISAIIIRPIAGYWMERVGAKIILVSSVIIFAVSSVCYFFPSSMPQLLILRFFHGIGFGMATTAAGAIVADILPDSRRGEGMGYFIMSTNTAMVMGPFLGLTAINQWGASVLFALCIVSSLIAVAGGLFIRLPLNESLNKTAPLKLNNLFELSIIPISLTGALFALIYSSILSFVSVYANEIGLMNVSSLFFVVFAVVLLLSRPFTGKWFDLYGENWIIYPALVCFGIGMLILGNANTSFLFLLSAAFIGLGWGTVFPSLQTIAIQSAQPNRKGMATATFLSIFDIGIGLGSLLVGYLITGIGFQSVYEISSIVILVGIFIYYLLHGKKVSSMRKTGQSSTSH